MKDMYLTVTKCLLDVMFFLGIPITIISPFFLKWYSQIDAYYQKFYIILAILVFIMGILACLIVYELRKMIKTVIEDNCFVMENAYSLKKMGNYSFIISFAAFISMCLDISPERMGAFVVFIVFAIAGLFSKVLANVFAKAISYKVENDMTI